MRDWNVAPLRDLAGIRVSNVDKKTSPAERPVRLCNYMDVYANDYIRKNLPFMEATASDAEFLKFKVDRGDVLITKDSETPDDIGIPAVVADDVEDLVCGYHLALLKPNAELVDPVFLSKQLGSAATAKYFARCATGSTRYGLSNRAISNASVAFPSLSRQRKIASILARIDAAIEQTESLIDKYRQIKAGLMHDLFTRGVLPSGAIRPPIEDAPALYKQTAVGWMPVEWQIKGIRECGHVKLGRQRSPDQHSGRWTMPYLRVANVLDGWIDFHDVLEMDFTPSERNEFSLMPGDILLNEGQSLELVGRSALYRGEVGAFCFQNTLVRFRCVDLNVPGYFAARFKLWLDQGRFQAIAKQTTSVAHLGADRFARMKCSVPEVAEQERIAARIDSADEHIDNIKLGLRKLHQVKAGLMQDLLTGRVSVNVDEPIPEPAHA